ncbi:MAG: cell envelope-related transcriptional attenuator [uncultured bacterium]|nr:MAG: cell envelope-related transcriptional attenuator [uncultured bacterium]
MSPNPKNFVRKILLSLLIIFFVFSLSLFFYLRPYYNLVKKITGVSPLQFIKTSGGFKQTEGLVNFLLLGVAGANNEGANLTDSIMVASFDLKNNSLYLVSVPRDIWSKNLQDKVNSAYYYGEKRKKGDGFILSKTEIGDIVGLPIHYAILINFDQFSKLIDFLDGIEVIVENSFDDFKYPIAGKENDLCSGDKEFKCRYQHISFKKGPTHMDGVMALKFVRSRNAKGEEGTDFARGRREQKIIMAISDKILSRFKKFEFEASELEELYLLIDTLVKRDIENKEIVYLAKTFFSQKIIIKNITLSKDFFIVPNYQDYRGKYVLIPKDNDFKTIQNYIKQKIRVDN